MISSQKQTKSPYLRRSFVYWRFCFALTMIMANIMPFSGVMASSQAAPLAQATNQLALTVVSARTELNAPNGPVAKGDPVTEYQYMISVDNTGDPTQARQDGCSPDNPGYPDSCNWPSIRAVPGAAPIYTQGNQDDFANGNTLNLPNGKYLISVIADGFKIDGEHFTVPLSGPVTVAMQPHPLPPATMRVKVFGDFSPVNGMFDAPAEQGLAGFRVIINDILGQVSVDVFGNPLCTTYDANGEPNGQTDCLRSDANGDIAVPNLGPNRFDVLVVPPDGTNWTETTTLEGSPSWDTWLQEGGTGLDNEFVVAGEPFPWTVFGFTRPLNTLPGGATGGVKGTIQAASVYIPQQGGVPYNGSIWDGFSGAKILGPVEDAWVALSDLQNGDTATYVAKANSDGTFQINGVPDGDYFFTWWDTNLFYILDWIQVTVSNGQMTDIGEPFLTGWFTPIDGYVYNDLNSNGVKDSGEPGIANYTVVLKDRENSEIDRMSIVATTDATGYYSLPKAYPMGSWMMLEAYNDRFYTTGFTYQVDNQPTPTTVLGSAVDVSVLPMLGQHGRLDWGVRPYDPTGVNGPRTGGIVGTVSYETTRNELDPRYLAVEGWQPGIPNLRVDLFAPIDCNTNPGTPCDVDGYYELAPDGSYAKGALINSALTEQWAQPTDCIARGVTGTPLVYGVDHQVLPADPTGKRCLEGPVMGTQFQPEFGQLDGNYGFGEACFISTSPFVPGEYDADTETCTTGTMMALPAWDYLVAVDSGTDELGRKLYQVVREEDINVFNGDQFVPDVPPPACAGALHTVDVAGIGADGPQAVNNPSFAAEGGTPYEGQLKPLCDVKLVTLNNGKSIAPTFDFFTEVPLPGRWKGYMIDDLTVSTNLQDLFLGEKAGAPNMPIGVYDFSNRLLHTISSDANGVFEVLLPSTTSINCPTPSGVCPNVYYMLGNDPGQPESANPNYNPQYRTIGASFEIYPGLIIPSDLAPTQIVPGVLAGGTNYTRPPQCTLDAATPQIFAVDKPYHTVASGAGTITIRGQGFGASQGTGSVTLDGTTTLPVSGWSDTQITVGVPATTATGPRQLKITNGSGKSTVNGLSYHVIGSSMPAFPANAVIDNFNRSNGALGASWAGSTSQTLFRIDGNNVQVRLLGGNIYRSGGSENYGADQEAYFTFSKALAGNNRQGGLLLKVDTGGLGVINRYISVKYNATTSSVIVATAANAIQVLAPIVQGTIPGVTFAVNDQLGARVLANGVVSVYKNATLIGTVNIATTANPWPAGFVSGGGRIGASFTSAILQNFNTPNDARFDNFGGGNVISGSSYNPNLYEVGPGKSFTIIQSALDAAAASNGSDLVVVYPRTPELWNPLGAYFENLVIYEPVALQGVGPGGVYANNTSVLGSIVDGRGVAGDTAYSANWQTFVTGLVWDGVQAIYEGAVVYVLAENGEFTASNSAVIDGFSIQGGDQQGFANNLNPIDPTVKDIAAVQGGGVFLNGYARYTKITNNIMQSNGGAYASAIRVGTPHVAGALNDNQNDNIRIANNRIIANGGTNLAGAIGLFSGSENYEVAANDICGNFSAEYGGGISHYGLSPNGSIHHNRIYFNRSYDEGGGIMIAGELPANPTTLSPGAGAVNIYNNLLQANLSNDDGGGLRFLMAGNFQYNVYNNIIVNNISTHEGGGVSLNDAPNVRFYNNTVMKNITTASAVTSNGLPAPTGFATSRNSTLLQNTLPGSSPLFSNPVMFNNIFWDNRAGTFTGMTVAGIGLAGDPNPINHWDTGVSNVAGALLAPTNSLLQVTTGTIASPSNIVGSDPLAVTQYDVSVSVAAWRALPRFVNPLIVTVDANPNQLGDYHINSGSPARNAGAASKSGINAPATDYDGSARPQESAVDIGADEVGTAVVAPLAPSTLDTFNRTNGIVGADWSATSGTNNFRINNQQLESSTLSGNLLWMKGNFGDNQEVQGTLTLVGNSSAKTTRWQGLFLKVNGGNPNSRNASAIQVRFAATKGVEVRTKVAGGNWVKQATFLADFSNGDTLAARSQNDGMVAIYKNGTLIGSINVSTGPNPWPSTLALGGGQVGVYYNFAGGRMDNFVGNNVTPTLLVTTAATEALGEQAESEPETVLAIDVVEDEEESPEAGSFSTFLPLVTK